MSARAGTLRLADDATTVGLQLERQRAAGITEPYAAVYEDALDVQYRAVVTGQIGSRFTALGPQRSVEAWLAAKRQSRFAARADQLVRCELPPIGGTALCMDSVEPGEAWCAWAADGIVVEFVFIRTPAVVAWDRMTEMLPDIVSWT